MPVNEDDQSTLLAVRKVCTQGHGNVRPLALVSTRAPECEGASDRVRPGVSRQTRDTSVATENAPVLGELLLRCRAFARRRVVGVLGRRQAAELHQRGHQQQARFGRTQI